MSANHTTRGARSGDYPYFRSLWNLVVVLLLGAAFLMTLVGVRVLDFLPPDDAASSKA